MAGVQIRLPRHGLQSASEAPLRPSLWWEGR
jgi:hypothetical protein